MLTVWLLSLGSVLIVSLISLIGAIIFAFKVRQIKKALIFFVSFSAGALIGGAFLHLLPEAVEKLEFGLLTSFMLIGGIFIFFILEKYIHWRHCHEPASENHPHPLGKMNLIGDGLHNFLDGLIIASAYLISWPVGLAATIAIILHEIPQEISDFGVLLHSGYSVKKALILNLFSALLAVIGVVLGLTLGATVENFATYILPFAAAGFIYIAAADLIPELHKETKMSKSLWQILIFGLGVLVMYFLTFLE